MRKQLCGLCSSERSINFLYFIHKTLTLKSNDCSFLTGFRLRLGIQISESVQLTTPGRAKYKEIVFGTTTQTIMELSIIAVFVASFIFSVGSHPKHSDIIPKDYYKRQILQPIPGYIPVYIKADGETIVRSEIKKQSPNAPPEKVAESKEKQLFKQSDEEISTNSKKSDEIRNESPVTDTKTLPANLQEKHEPAAADQPKFEKHSTNPHIKSDDLKP